MSLDTLNLIFAAGGFLVGGFALWFALLGHGGYKTRLRNEEAIRLDAAKSLTAPKPWNAYLQTLETALDTLTSWMGKRARLILKDGERGEWGRSASWCISLAMVYPLTFLLISWLFGGTGTIGEVEFLPADIPAWRRGLMVAILLVFGTAFYFLARYADTIDAYAKAWLDRRLWQRLPEQHRRHAKTALPLVVGAAFFAVLYVGLDLPPALAGTGALAGALAFALAGAGAVAGALAGTFAVAVIGAGAGAFAGTFALAFAGAVAGAVAGAGAVAFAGTGAFTITIAGALAGALADGTAAITFSTTFLLIFLLLPFVNALFDWASWQVSRWLGDNLLTISRQHGYPRWKRTAHYVKDIVIDGAFALACLPGLAWAIPRVIEAFNGFIQWLSSESIFDIKDYLCAAATEPLGDGLWATSMLFSTLLPTAIHFLLLLFAPLLWWLSPSDANRARAAHLTHGTRPPDIDLRGKTTSDKATWPKPMPKDFGAQALREEQAVFQGHLNETTLHAITMQLRFWRWIYYAAGLVIVGALLYWLGGLFISSWRPLPEILLWIAHNFDYAPVRQCFPEALPTAPFETLAI